MVRFIAMALVASAATLSVVRAVRLEPSPIAPSSEHHAIAWHEHAEISSNMLQVKLTNMLAEVTTVEAGKEEPGDAQAQESEWRELVARIKKDWQSANATTCHQQLGQVIDNLTRACEDLRPKADWLLNYTAPALSAKTCAESVIDVFALGKELVETLRVSRHSVASLEVDAETLRRYQALSFLRSWLVNLTWTNHSALLWAGFWDGGPHNKRATKTSLFEFAKTIDHATIHPDSFLGQAIEASQDLNACYTDPQTNELAGNMWSIASMSFVLGMRDKAQGTVVALVNKNIVGERSLSQSVLFKHEIPTVGLAAWGLGYWSPQVLVLDLMGTCEETSPALQKQLFARLPSWAMAMTHWSREAFAMRSQLQWQCIDCSGPCSLDNSLAEHVEKLIKVKQDQDQKNHNLRQVVSPRLARRDSSEDSWVEDEVLAFKLYSLLWNKQRSKALKLSHFATALHEKRLSLTSAEPEIRELHGPARQRRVEQLLRDKADPNASDRLGRTVLIYAADDGRLELVEALLKAGAQLEARDQRGRTAFMEAVVNEQLEVAEALLKAGAQLEGVNEYGETALMFAARKGYPKIVKALVKAGAQLEARGEHGDTALLQAATNGHSKVVKALAKAGAQLEASDEHGATALIQGAYEGHIKVVKALMKARAQLEARDERGKTPLMHAASEGHPELVEALLKAGAQLEARDQRGRTALMEVVMTIDPTQLSVVEVLTKAGAQLEACNEDNQTALMLAARYSLVSVVEALLDAGARRDARNKWGRTALDIAESRNGFGAHPDLVKALKVGPSQRWWRFW